MDDGKAIHVSLFLLCDISGRVTFGASRFKACFSVFQFQHDHICQV